MANEQSAFGRFGIVVLVATAIVGVAAGFWGGSRYERAKIPNAAFFDAAAETEPAKASARMLQLAGRIDRVLRPGEFKFGNRVWATQADFVRYGGRCGTVPPDPQTQQGVETRIDVARAA